MVLLTLDGCAPGVIGAALDRLLLEGEAARYALALDVAADGVSAFRCGYACADLDDLASRLVAARELVRLLGRRHVGAVELDSLLNRYATLAQIAGGGAISCLVTSAIDVVVAGWAARPLVAILAEFVHAAQAAADGRQGLEMLVAVGVAADELVLGVAVPGCDLLSPAPTRGDATAFARAELMASLLGGGACRGKDGGTEIFGATMRWSLVRGDAGAER